MWNSDLRALSAIRRLLLSFAVLGLLFAPSAGFAHGAMQQVEMIGVADHSPCCPESPADDCPRCALMTSCALSCVDYLAMEQGFAMVVWRRAAPVMGIPAQTFASVDHPPPRKPPRSWICCRMTAGDVAARYQARSSAKYTFNTRQKQYCYINSKCLGVSK